MGYGSGAPGLDTDRYFTDGEYEYAVRAAPAAFPNLLTLDPVGVGGDLGQVFFGLMVSVSSGFVASRRDARWKVLVGRRRLKFPRVVHAIAVEFFGTVEEAEARQVEIRRGWVAGSHAADPVIPFRSIGELRKASRGRTA